MSKILHIFNFEEKFSKPFFYFLQDNNFDLSQHCLFHYGKTNPEYKTFKFKYTFARYYSVLKHLKLLKSLFQSKQIIVHNLASPWLLLYLYLFPSLNPKVYWVIWGKDLYFYHMLKNKRFYHYIYEYFRKRVFKRIKHVVTYIPGDADLARDWYKVNAQFHECIMYPSNLFKESTESVKGKTAANTVTIQVGNSADPSNNHKFILKKLEPFKSENLSLVVPLSYGNKKHAEKIELYANQAFPDQCITLTNFLPLQKYLELLKKIDIAIFAHKRQQAMGNIITLISMGKKVYLDPETTSYKFLHSIGLKIFPLTELNLEPLDEPSKLHNIERIKVFFSPEKLKIQWNSIFLNS